MKKLAASALTLVMLIGPMGSPVDAKTRKTKRTKIVRLKRKARNGSSCRQPGAIYIDSKGRRFRCVTVKRRRRK
jgi:hypothetical protein